MLTPCTALFKRCLPTTGLQNLILRIFALSHNMTLYWVTGGAVFTLLVAFRRSCGSGQTIGLWWRGMF